MPYGAAKVTRTLLFALKREPSPVVYANMNIDATNSLRVRASRFFSDRYAYRTRPNGLSEVVAFTMLIFIAVWPMVLLANAMVLTVR